MKITSCDMNAVGRHNNATNKARHVNRCINTDEYVCTCLLNIGDVTEAFLLFFSFSSFFVKMNFENEAKQFI